MVEINFGEKGYIPAIAQDYLTGEILMQAYVNEEALKKTIETKLATYYSRSRKSLWVKGETSGNFQRVEQILVDCDKDSLIYKVAVDGPACHTNHRTCFYRDIDGKEIDDEPEFVEDKKASEMLYELYKTIEERKLNPVEGSYTNYLFEKGIDKIAKKVGEEATEVVIASKNRASDEIIYETADLLYHLWVLLCENNVYPDDIFNELKRRHK